MFKTREKPPKVMSFLSSFLGFMFWTFILRITLCGTDAE